MALYCIGDIQGCSDALERLLAHIGFSPSRDTVYLLGDLVNRGPDSAAVLRRCMRLDGALRPLLGNHDLHLLAAAHGTRRASRRDTLTSVLDAPDRNTLLGWLCQQPDVERVLHPSLPECDPDHLVGRQMSGPGSVLSFVLAGGFDQAAAVAERVRLITHAVSLGGVDSLIQHPASLTHRPLPPEARPHAGLLRLSVGLEDSDDLTHDLALALEGSRA